MMALFDRNPQKTSDVPNAAAATVANAAMAAYPATGANIPSVVETRRPSAKPTSKPDETQGSQLIVGPNIKLKGAGITDCDTLIVEGHVDATMESRMMQIAQHGAVSGTASIDVAEIYGGFTGNLTVRKCLTIHTTGRVTGKIRYGKLVIEEGGELDGDIKKLGEDENELRNQHVSLAGKTAEKQ
jgi:cytoskeletal protein CcmA (bactofilin family)